MKREGFDVARCTIERLMKDIGIQGVRRGKKMRTTVPDKSVPCPRDKVNRNFHAPAPNRLWVSDFTYVSTWAGFVYVAFIIDVFARRIVGWRVIRALVLCRSAAANGASQRSRSACQFPSMAGPSKKPTSYESLKS